LPDMEMMTEKEAGLLNPLQLAYLGDAVWEKMVRERLIRQRKNVHHMHQECVEMVNAAAQARHLALLKPYLSEQESAIVLRGRNAHAKHPAPRHQDAADYAEATGFETLVGYLYLVGARERLSLFFRMICGEEIDNA